MMKRIICLISVCFLLFAFPVKAEVSEEVFIGERIDVAFFDVWLHADGLTWQDTDGDLIADEPYGGTDLDGDPEKEKYERYLTFQAKPKQEWEKEYEPIRVEASIDWLRDFTKEDYLRVGGGGKVSKDGKEYIFLGDFYEFIEQVWGKRPHDYQLAPEISPHTVKFYLHDKVQAENIKRDDQADLVEGWRWYLPIYLKFYGVKRVVGIDLEVVEVEQVSPVRAGSKQMGSCFLRNNGGKLETFRVNYWADGKVVGSEVLELEGGEDCRRNFNWQVPWKKEECLLRVEVEPVVGEIDLGNNWKEIVVEVEKPDLVKPDCLFMNLCENEWLETYSWRVSYDCSYFDENGVYHPSTCWRTRTETVNYRESLEVILEINTKQGEDRGRESRGYWEIYPATQRGGKFYGRDPNQITRSGYGFEVVVKTIYWTDWETKVPRAARAKGGSFEGPGEVVVQFHDRGEIIRLEPVEKRQGKDREITVWKLPEESYVFSDGETIWERKYYTEVELPDGEYLVRAIVAPCGKEIGEICQDEKVVIYGSIYDDLYTRPAKKQEW